MFRSLPLYRHTISGIPVIEEYRNLVKIVDILGREVSSSQHIILFYIYDDGTCR